MGRCLYKELGMLEGEFRACLENLVSQDMSITNLAEKFGVSGAAMHRWLKKFGLKRRAGLRDREWLYEQYITQGKSAAKIAEELGVTYQAVLWHIETKGIPKRSFEEAQRNRKRQFEKPNAFHGSFMRSRPHSYCFWWNGLYFASTAEYVFYKMNHKTHVLETQPFIINNRRPDFLMDGKHVIEIKCERRQVTEEKLRDYEKLASDIKSKLGYRYEIIFVMEKYPIEYKMALAWLRKHAIVGKAFELESEI